MTKYASAIIKIVSTEGEHLTAEQIFLKMKEQYPSVVLATVYNNLGRLTAENRIRRISLEGFPDRYDQIVPHDHLFCRSCGRLSDVTLADLTAQLEAQLGFPIEAYDLKLFYTCAACRQQAETIKQR